MFDTFWTVDKSLGDSDDNIFLLESNDNQYFGLAQYKSSIPRVGTVYKPALAPEEPQMLQAIKCTKNEDGSIALNLIPAGTKGLYIDPSKHGHKMFSTFAKRVYFTPVQKPFGYYLKQEDGITGYSDTAPLSSSTHSCYRGEEYPKEENEEEAECVVQEGQHRLPFTTVVGDRVILDYSKKAGEVWFFQKSPFALTSCTGLNPWAAVSIQTAGTFQD